MVGGAFRLSVAYRIASKRPDVRVELIEKSDRLGGVGETDGEWVCDVAVNATGSSCLRLVDDLGLGDRFAPSNPEAGWWVYTRGRSQNSPWTVLRRGPLKMLNGVRRPVKAVGRWLRPPLPPVNTP